MDNKIAPTPEEIKKSGEDDLDKTLDKHIERMKRIKEIEAMHQATSPPKSLTDMLGGPSITSQLGPILSGINKMISTMPTKTKLEGNINGGNFSIEIVDEKTCDIAMKILGDIYSEYRTKQNNKKENKK